MHLALVELKSNWESMSDCRSWWQKWKKYSKNHVKSCTYTHFF